MTLYRLILRKEWASQREDGSVEVRRKELYELPLERLQDFAEVCGLVQELLKEGGE